MPPQKMLTERTFDTGEVVINYAEGETAGPPLVMLHGATLNWQSFLDLIPTLERDWRLYACDLRGHGKSGRAATPHHHADFVRDSVALIDGRVAKPVALAGFSLGGAIALGVAAVRPDLVRALMLFDPPLAYCRDHGVQSFPGPYEWCVWLAQTLSAPHHQDDLLQRCRERVGNNDEAGARGLFDMIADQDPRTVVNLVSGALLADYRPEQLFPRLACPTLLIYGEPSLSSVISQDDVDLFRKLVPRGIAIQVKDVGHDVIWQPVAHVTLGHVSEFLESAARH